MRSSRPGSRVVAALLPLLAGTTLLGCGRGEGGAEGEAGGPGRAHLRRFWEVHDRARSLYAAGDHAAAEHAYLEALEIDPTHESTLYNLAHIELVLGKHEAALEHLRTLRQVEPRETKALLLAAAVLMDSRPWAPFDLREAASLVDRALELNREESGPFLLRGKIALLAGEHDEARDRLEIALRANPRSAEALNLLAFLELWRGRTEEAAALAARAAEAARGAPPPAGVAGEGDTAAGGAGSHRPQLLLSARLAEAAREVARAGGPAGPREPPDPTGAAPLAATVRPLGGRRAGGAIAAADLDGDGAVDLVLGSLSGPIDLFRGAEDGFEPAGTAAVVGARLVIASDLDGDGRPDLCAAASGEAAGTTILRSTGPFRFEVLPSSFASPRKPLALAAAERPGGADLIEAGAAAAGSSPVRVLNVESGRCEAREVPGFAAGEIAVSAAVLRATARRPALAVLAMAHGPPAAIRRGADSWERADAPAGLEGAGRADRLLAADLDGDGADELIVVRGTAMAEALLWLVEGKAGAPAISVCREVEPGRFEAGAPSVPRLGGGISSLVAGDLDGDGRTDLIAPCGGPEPWRLEPWWVLLGAPDGPSLRRGPALPIPASASGAAVIGPRRLVVTAGGWLPWMCASAWIVDLLPEPSHAGVAPAEPPAAR